MIVRFDFGQPVAIDSAMLLSLELAVAVALDPVMSLMTDSYFLLVLDVLLPVALSVNIDMLLTSPVFDAQFVGAVATWAAQGSEYTARLMRRQVVGRDVFGVVQAAADQWLVRVALQKRHQDFHADPRNGHAAVAITSPAGRHSQPAAALVIAVAFTIPMKLHLDPAMPVAVDFLIFRASHHRSLTAKYSRFGMMQRRAIQGLPGSSKKGIAIALLKVVRALDFMCGLFKNLRLVAFVTHLSEQPQIIPVLVGMSIQWQKMTADQTRLIALTFAQPVIVAVAFKGSIRPLQTLITVGETAGVVIVLKIRLRLDIR
ncbi:Flavin reductase [Pseudomonas savastanoi pv. glycinea]|nr:Flavin reductase [Pseudomonas savastanoi pv. glycinea]